MLKRNLQINKRQGLGVAISSQNSYEFRKVVIVVSFSE